ncbi:hypothetical protein ILUMI_06979 [Ignelater luminosus]|uniref:Rotatin n=1 Tax=Ignelater luminosus TaxID=2038154 RepID=A0A8K0D8Y3_IGNLU|nr:hypothetical protein ILUMI_06979 [Ignelater luminosus]
MDLLALKSSSLDYCISKCLTNVQNGTSHNVVIDTIGKLEAYVNLYTSTKDDTETGKKEILAFPWEYSFSRFLNAPPANEEDMLLLIAVIKFLTILVPLYTLKDQPCWITATLKNSSHCLPNILQVDSSPEFELKILHQELLNLITVCVWHEQQFFDLRLPSPDEVPSGSWLHIIEIISDDLKFNDTQHFYNLAYLDSMLSCLVHLTAALGWSQSKANTVPKEPIPALILGLCELVGAFHCGKGSSAAASLMGLSITRHVLLVLNHLLAEMQYFSVKLPEMCFIGENAIEENILYTLSALWLSRDVVLRAAILQLLAGLAVSPRAAIELVQETRNSKTGNGIWETALTILIDHEEASIARENAATLLGNLASHTNLSGNHVTLIGNLAPITVKKSNNAIEAILFILEEFKFYKELEIILSSLYLRASFYIDNKERDRILSPPQLTDKGEYAYAYTKFILPDLTAHSANSNSTKSSIEDPITVATPSLLKAVAIFVYNLLILAEEEITNILQEYGLIKMFFRSLTIPPARVNNTKDLSLYCDILEMNTAVCALLSKAVGNNQICLGTILHTRDCLNVMLSLLNPAVYFVNLPQLIYLRNRLWTEVFNLIGALLNSDVQRRKSEQASSNVRGGEALMIVTSVLNECGHQPFLQTLCQAISFNSSSDLQQSALSSLTSLLCLENKTSTNNDIKSVECTPTIMSVQNMLDTVRTPRTLTLEEHAEENAENIEPEQEEKDVKVVWERKSHKRSPNQTNILENAYFGKVNQKINELNKKRIQNNKLYEEKINKSDKKELSASANETLMAGAELCRILLYLYDISNIKSKDGKQVRRKAVIVNALTSILCISQEAKRLALQNGLVEMSIQQLKELHVKLSLESVEYFRRISDKKRVNPVLKELGSVIGLMTNFMLGDESIKCATSTNGIADAIHKLWIWLCVERPLLSDSLKMLCTYTTDCYVACQSLTLTSSVAGSGPRKVPSSLSLLHEIILLISKEMDLVSRTHDLTILELAFNVLQNSCAAVECRNILAKSNLLVCISRLHPALTKKQKPWESVEYIWLEFLLTFTSYAEGQISVAKYTDALDLIMMLTSSTKSSNKKEALMVLRNIAFYQPNRPRLLNSDDFLSILVTKLTNGNTEEKYIVAAIMWTLIANNQKAKLILKCAGLDEKLQECIKRLSLSPDENGSPEAVTIMLHVLNSLRDGEKNK